MEETVFTQIAKGELPAEIVHETDAIMVIMTVMPHKPGHCMVIPKQAVDRFYELGDGLYQQVMMTARTMAQVVQVAFQPKRVGLQIEGLAVPHAHVHIIPIDKIGDMDHDRARSASTAELKVNADKLRAVITELGVFQ